MHATGLLAAAGVTVVAGSAFAQVSIDGTIGAEWTGAITRTVAHDSGAAEGNFGSPSNVTTGAAYTTYMRADASYVYFAVQATPGGGGSAPGNFMNIYLTTDPLVGSTIGLEVGNNNFFVPGVAGNYPAAGITTFDDTHAGVVEVAIPLSFFTTDPLGMGFNTSGSVVQWRLSQSLGYSVAGGASYGPDRLGVVALPAPGAGAVAALGGLTALRRRRRA